MALEHRRKALGDVRPVLWERDAPAIGLTDTYLRVRRAGPGGVANPDRLENVIETVRLVGLDGDVIVGEPV